VAVVVDDVQWADQASLAVIARMCRAAPQLRLLIVLSVRPPPRPSDVTRLVAAVKAAGGLELTVGPLTDAEVADLIAAIAERMYLSRRTVQTHVSHILTKTGLTSRVELAAAIASQGDGPESPPSG
jgi:predicted ATPase